MEAKPFVQAALAEGDAWGKAIDAVDKVVTMRLEEEAKIQYNEKMLAAEEQMRGLMDKYKDRPRMSDVFNDEGTGAWQVDVKEMKERLGEDMISRSMQNAFNARFGQQEIALRFQLRDEMERRIKARAAASDAARMKALEKRLGDPDTPLELLPLLLASNDEELKADVRTGRITDDMRAAVNMKLIGNVAKNAATGYIGSDPTRGFKLAKALEYQDAVDRGEMTHEEAAQLAGFSPEEAQRAAYTLAVLQLAPRADAVEALSAGIKDANTIDGVMDEIRTENEAREVAANDAMYNSLFGVDPAAPASPDLSNRLAEGALRLIGKQKGDPITGREYIDASLAYLDQRNAITPEKRKLIETHRNPQTMGPFAKNSDPATFAQLTVAMNAGTLTMEALNGNMGSLSLADYTSLAGSANREADQSLSKVLDYAASAFKYNKISGATDELSRMAEASYASVASVVTQEFNMRRASGNPMTSNELNARVNELVTAERDGFRRQMQQSLTDYVSTMGSKGIPSLSVGNEVTELDAWYNSIAAPTTKQQSIYLSTRAEIMRRIKMMEGQ